MQIKTRPAPAILDQVIPHHVVNHSSQPEATNHRSSDAPVLNNMMTWLEEVYLTKAFHQTAYELYIIDISEAERQ
jgi:hypothetical protein